MPKRESIPFRELCIGSILVLLSLNAAAVGIGVSPGSVEFKGVLRSGYAEREIILSTSSSEPLDCEVSAEGPFKNWTSYVPGKTFTLPPKSQTKIKIVIEPPSDIPNGVYDGFVTVSLSPKSDSKEGTGSAISAGVSVKTSVEISDIETRHYQMQSPSVRDTEETKPIEFAVVLENDGNIRLNPRIHIDLLNSDRTSILKSVDYSDKLLLPTKKEEVLISVPNDLPIGTYSGRIIAYLDDQKMGEDVLDFEVLERGSLRIQGRLMSVELNKIWVYTGELVEIRATFKNDGIMSTPAIFSGKASIDDTVIDIINSDEIEVSAGQDGQLVAYFTPKKPGRYVISGRVKFFNKVTAEKSSILNVKAAEATVTTTPSPNKPAGDPGNGTDTLLIAAIVLAAVVLVAALIFWKRGARKGGEAHDDDELVSRSSRKKHEAGKGPEQD